MFVLGIPRTHEPGSELSGALARNERKDVRTKQSARQRAGGPSAEVQQQRFMRCRGLQTQTRRASGLLGAVTLVCRQHVAAVQGRAPSSASQQT